MSRQGDPVFSHWEGEFQLIKPLWLDVHNAAGKESVEDLEVRLRVIHPTARIGYREPSTPLTLIWKTRHEIERDGGKPKSDIAPGDTRQIVIGYLGPTKKLYGLLPGNIGPGGLAAGTVDDGVGIYAVWPFEQLEMYVDREPNFPFLGIGELKLQLTLSAKNMDACSFEAMLKVEVSDPGLGSQTATAAGVGEPRKIPT